jgi:DNA-binding CsgD family transcriptional regulator
LWRRGRFINIAVQPDPFGSARVSSQRQTAQTTERLKLRDVRAMFRLVGEVRELGADPSRWRPHLVRRISELMRAEVVTSSEVHFRHPRAGDTKVLDVGWGTDTAGGVWEFHTEQDHASPDTYLLALGQPPPGAADDADSDVPLRPTQPVYGGKLFILSQYPLPHIAAVDQLGVHRAWGDDPFTAADRRLIRLFHVELGRLWKRDTLNQTKNPQIELSPRLKQTLDALVNGHSEKQIAAKLELSRHTIHNYVKALHQRFEVSSRGELLARVNRERSSDFTPKLSVPPA